MVVGFLFVVAVGAGEAEPDVEVVDPSDDEAGDDLAFLGCWTEHRDVLVLAGLEVEAPVIRWTRFGRR